MYTLGNVELLQVATFTYTELKGTNAVITFVCDVYLWTSMSVLDAALCTVVVYLLMAAISYIM